MGHMLEVAISKRAVVHYNLTEDLPAIEADATQLRQVVMNLITNASEAIGGGSGAVSVATGVMRVDRSYLVSTYLDEQLPEGLYVTLDVSDTGCGMDRATQAKLFDPFYTTKFTGRGLGMAAVLGIVRGHRGTIKVYSEVDKGTTVKVLFPAVADAVPVATDRSQPEAETPEPATVLLVDDEKAVLAIARSMLEKMGMTVITAGDGEEALLAYREHRDEIDCVILDLTMPRMDGEETFRELRRLNAELQVILSSGYNEQEIIKRFVGKGLAGFIQKPYGYDKLKRVLGTARHPER